MLNDTEIKRFYDYIESLKLKFPVTAIAKATGFSKGNVSKYLSKTGEPSENFINAVYKKFPISFNNVPRGMEQAGAAASEIHNLPSTEILKALTTLTESNKGLVDSNKSITETNKVIADTNALLAQRLLKESATADLSTNRSVDEPAILMDLLGVLAEVAFHAGIYHSEVEARHRISIRLKLHESVDKNLAGTRTDAGRKSTA